MTLRTVLLVLCAALILADPAAAEDPEPGIDPAVRKTAEGSTFINPFEYPNLYRIERFLGLERQIRFDLVASERKTAVSELKTKLDVDDLDALLLFSRNLEEEPDDPWAKLEFYNFLSRHYDPMYQCRCQELKKYVEYVNLWWDIDWDKASLEAAIHTAESEL